MKVEGYEIRIERADGKFVVSVPELPGCTVQVDRKEDAVNAIREMIGLYILELASKKPRKPDKGDDEPASRVKPKDPKDKVRK